MGHMGRRQSTHHHRRASTPGPRQAHHHKAAVSAENIFLSVCWVSSLDKTGQFLHNAIHSRAALETRQSAMTHSPSPLHSEWLANRPPGKQRQHGAQPPSSWLVQIPNQPHEHHPVPSRSRRLFRGPSLHPTTLAPAVETTLSDRLTGYHPSESPPLHSNHDN